MSTTSTTFEARRDRVVSSVRATGDHQPPPVRVLLVDDDRLASYSLWALLNWQPGIRVSASAQSINEAVDMVHQLRPDVCLVSAGLESGDGMRLADRLTELPAPPHVLIYADRLDAELDGVASAGAGGIISRYADPHEVADLIARVAAGKATGPVIGPS